MCECFGEVANRLRSDLRGGSHSHRQYDKSNEFQPAAITVARGTTVQWVNTGVMPHTVTDDPSKAARPSNAALPSGAQTWDSGQLNGGQSFSHTFDTPGDYTYFCIPHESLGMVGHITVTP